MCEFWLSEKENILDADSQHIQHLGEPCPNPARYCHIAGKVLTHNGLFKKVVSLFHQTKCFRMVKSTVKTSVFHETGSISSLMEVRSLIRSDTLWNATMVARHHTDDTLAELTYSGKANLYPKHM